MVPADAPHRRAPIIPSSHHPVNSRSCEARPSLAASSALGACSPHPLPSALARRALCLRPCLVHCCLRIARSPLILGLSTQPPPPSPVGACIALPSALARRAFCPRPSHAAPSALPLSGSTYSHTQRSRTLGCVRVRLLARASDDGEENERVRLTVDLDGAADLGALSALGGVD